MIRRHQRKTSSMHEMAGPEPGLSGKEVVADQGPDAPSQLPGQPIPRIFINGNLNTSNTTFSFVRAMALFQRQQVQRDLGMGLGSPPGGGLPIMSRANGPKSLLQIGLEATGSDPIPRPETIQEDDAELVQVSFKFGTRTRTKEEEEEEEEEKEEAGPSNGILTPYEPSQTMMAIRDPGVADIRRRHAEPSIITDIDQRLYTVHFDQCTDLTRSRDTSGKPRLGRKLWGAIVDPLPGVPQTGGFCPISKLDELINEESVALELGGWERLRELKKEKTEARKRAEEEQKRRSSTGDSTGIGLTRQYLTFPSFDAVKEKRDLLGGQFRILGSYLTWPRRSERIAELGRRICGQPDFRRIFAILVLMEIPQKISAFLKADISDSELPFEGNRDSGEFRLYRRQTSGMEKMETRTKISLVRRRELKCFRGWKVKHKISFEENQWKVLAPGFDRGSGNKPVKHYLLDERARLPFLLWEDPVSWQRMRNQEGAFGRVFRVKIHESHYKFAMPKVWNGYFCVKRLHSQGHQDFEAEVMMYKLLSKHQNPHLTTLLMTYQQNGRYHLVFPWGETDLKSYWKETDPTKISALWVAGQCAGLAKGLLAIHGPHEIGAVNDLPHSDSFPLEFVDAGDHEHAKGVSSKKDTGMKCLLGHHGDIKAQNVLLFPNEHSVHDEGHADWTLKITDFGLAGFRRNKSSTGSNAHTPSYGAPEYATCGEVLRKSLCDIWALGCLYLEFITWFFGGWELFERFEEERAGDSNGNSFYRIHNEETCTAEVKPSVLRFIAKLREHPKCTDYFDHVLSMIECQMLVVDLEIRETTGRVVIGVLANTL
ncbi:hypothetical protein B7494_g2626 [Chlorociboria aeruginascens]|nr:hypothetical protein B7494_g2626 [Chlorociboria aeruginascens]